jgi:hypothetical protein
VRGKKRTRQNIEEYHLRHYGMQKLRDGEYELTFCYQDDADLDDQVHDLLRDISHEAELRYCFIEADMREKGTERYW